MAAANAAASRVLVRAFKQRGLGVKADAVAALLSVLSREEDVDGALEAILDAIKGACGAASQRWMICVLAYDPRTDDQPHPIDTIKTTTGLIERGELKSSLVDVATVESVVLQLTRDEEDLHQVGIGLV